MPTDLDLSQVLERLEQKIDAQSDRLEKKIDAQDKRLERMEETMQTMNVNLARLDERTTAIGERLEKIEGNVSRQDNRLWALLATTTITLIGGILTVLGKFLLFPT